MEYSKVVHLEKLMASRKNAVLQRLVWVMDGEIFSTDPQSEGSRPLSTWQVDNLMAELKADPEMRPILKYQESDRAGT